MSEHLTRYVALLRGINVGGNKRVPMADLKKMLEKMGFKNVKTLLASGNAMFDAPEEGSSALAKNIEAQFQKTFGFSSDIILRTKDQILELLKAAPFKGITMTDDTRLYVTFLGDNAKKSTLKIPYVSPEKNFRILRVTASDVCSVVVLIRDWQTTEGMKVLEKEFGKNVTTRNWNTVEKMVK